MISISQFKNIPKELRINYIANTIDQRGETRLYKVMKEESIMYDVINRSFDWSCSPQGHHFWFSLAHKYNTMMTIEEFKKIPDRHRLIFIANLRERYKEVDMRNWWERSEIRWSY